MILSSENEMEDQVLQHDKVMEEFCQLDINGKLEKIFRAQLSSDTKIVKLQNRVKQISDDAQLLENKVENLSSGIAPLQSDIKNQLHELIKLKQEHSNDIAVISNIPVSLKDTNSQQIFNKICKFINAPTGTKDVIDIFPIYRQEKNYFIDLLNLEQKRKKVVLSNPGKIEQSQLQIFHFPGQP